MKYRFSLFSMKDRFKKSLLKLDVTSLVTKFDLDLKGTVKVEIDGEQKVIPIEEKEDLYRCHIKGIEFMTKSISLDRALESFKKQSFKTFGKQSIPKQVFKFINHKWELANGQKW